MTYIILCSSDNVLSVKGGGNAWTILKLLEKFYENKNDKITAIGIFADAVISDKDSLKSVDDCMNEKTEAFLTRGELPFKRPFFGGLLKKVISSRNIVYRFLTPIYYLFLSLKRNCKAKKNLIDLINKLNINKSDVVVLDCHDPFSAYFMNKVKFPCRKISIAHSHEIGSQALNLLRIRNGVNCLVKKAALFIEKSGYEKCKYISFPSNGAMDTLLDDRPDLKNLFKNKIKKILYTGIKTKFNKSPENVKLDKSKTAKLLFVGRLVNEKGFDLALEAAKLLKSDGYNISLDVVGYGDLDPIKVFLKNNNLEDAVLLRGVLPHDKVLQLMLSSDILIAPHRRSVFDLVMLEAMHVGLPIVSTAVGGNLELIKSQKEGILVAVDNLKELVNGIKTMIDNDDLRSSIAINAQKYALDFFSEEAMFERYKDFFEEIVK